MSKTVRFSTRDYAGNINGIKEATFSDTELNAVKQAGIDVDKYVANEAPKRAVPRNDIEPKYVRF